MVPTLSAVKSLGEVLQRGSSMFPKRTLFRGLMQRVYIENSRSSAHDVVMLLYEPTEKEWLQRVHELQA